MEKYNECKNHFQEPKVIHLKDPKRHPTTLGRITELPTSLYWTLKRPTHEKNPIHRRERSIILGDMMRAKLNEEEDRVDLGSM